MLKETSSKILSFVKTNFLKIVGLFIVIAVLQNVCGCGSDSTPPVDLTGNAVVVKERL